MNINFYYIILKIIHVLLVALDAMKNDVHTTGKCDLTLARQMEPGTPGTWVLID
jgi:hypothetical protein